MLMPKPCSGGFNRFSKCIIAITFLDDAFKTNETLSNVYSYVKANYVLYHAFSSIK